MSFLGRVDAITKGDMETNPMTRLGKFGLAAALAVGGMMQISAVLAQSDPTSTGSLGRDYGTLISVLNAGKTPDLTAFNDNSSINCVKVSSLRPEGSSNAAALDSAIEKMQSQLTELRNNISSNSKFLDKVKSSCAMPDLDVKDVVAVEAGSGGAFSVYIDDRTS